MSMVDSEELNPELSEIKQESSQPKNNSRAIDRSNERFMRSILQRGKKDDDAVINIALR